jgi:hypothetical protein
MVILNPNTETTMKTLLAALLLAAGCLPAASATTLADVEVIDRSTGRPLETYRHRGRLYVAGTPGNRYAVSVRNRSGGRILTVLSVDGVNAVTGETAAAGQSGYVLAAGQGTEVTGWRKSLGEVAAFYFTRLPDSYAARTDRPENVGAIGVAVFEEDVPPPAPAAQFGAREKAESADRAAAAPKAESRIGTGHGERIASPVEQTEFRRRSSQPGEVIVIYYDSRPNLIARGIIPGAPRAAHPNPFPGGFVADPRG